MKTHISEKTIKKIITELSLSHPKNEMMERRVNQTVRAWSDIDGTEEELREFCIKNYISDEDELGKLLKKAEKSFDMIDGYMLETYRRIIEPLHLDTGEITEADKIFADFNPMSHLTEDFFHSKIAFLILLNFPVYTLEEKNELGKKWGDREWTMARLADRFSQRVPPEVIRKAMIPTSRAGMYISDYNVFMDRIRDGERTGLFPKGMKLISHWGLRDEIKALYREPGSEDRQELVKTILERIVRGEIPSCVINSGEYEWDPKENKVYKDGAEVEFESEGCVRYGHLKSIFEADRTIDPFTPNYPTAIERNFNGGVEISETEVRGMLETVLNSEVIRDLADYVSEKLGRPLRSFDIWYPGFRDASTLSEERLDSIVAEKYGDRAGFQKSIPGILTDLGFSKERAEFLASKITVDPSRGAGHAMGAGGTEFNSHLRTRFPGGKMNYNSYNVAIHELGHCVEQVFSLNMAPSPLMSGVPNTAFTEGFAFVFQGRDQDLLGVSEDRTRSDLMHRLHGFWHCFELSGVSLVCMDAWRRMYENPETTPAELRDFVIETAKSHWNKWFEPIFGEKDSILLAVYSHMIEYGLYLPNYPLGEIIRSQVESHIKGKSLAVEMEKLCTQGRLTPDAWLYKGTGRKISAESLINSAKEAIDLLRAMR